MSIIVVLILAEPVTICSSKPFLSDVEVVHGSAPISKRSLPRTIDGHFSKRRHTEWFVQVDACLCQRVPLSPQVRLLLLPVAFPKL